MKTGSWVENHYGCDCGALDCPVCHPENCREVECACCGEVSPLYELDDKGVCNDCRDKVKCDYCEEWHDSDSDNVTNDNGTYYCKSCFEEITAEPQERKPLTAKQKQAAVEIEKAIKKIEAMFAMN